MSTKLGFVLSGGGARGALQVGALRALLERGFQPDLLTGSSVGAINATFLALNGFTSPSLERLTAIWKGVDSLDLLPSNYLWLMVRAMLGRSSQDPSRRLRAFFTDHGLSPELRFSELNHCQLVIISSDLNSGHAILHGQQSDEKILDALMLSTALPPWFMPDRRHDRYLLDGAIMSHLPVEPALMTGATAIVAMDLVDIRDDHGKRDSVTQLLWKLSTALEKRQADLEMKLAEAQGVPLLYLGLMGEAPVPFWDFTHTDELIDRGYEIAIAAIDSHQDFKIV